MLKKIQNNSLIIAILLLGFILRWHQYGDYPVAGETKDEYAWSWLGESLLVGRAPTSWSWFGHYQNSINVNLSSQPFRIVSPVFDHPPLFSLIPGFMMHLKNMHGIVLPSITAIRAPMILIATLNIYLLYVVGVSLTNRQTALLSSILYATIPTFVISSRLVLAQNLLTSWLLLSVLIIVNHANGKKVLKLGVIAGLAILTKVSGSIVALISAIYVYKEHGIRSVFKFSAIITIFCLTWAVYGMTYDWNIFIESLQQQSNLTIGWGSIINLFQKMNIVDTPFFDGWVILGFIGLVSSFYETTKSSKIIATIFSVWLIFHISAVGEQTWHGWYRFPLFPFMALKMGILLEKSKNQIIGLIPFYILGVLPTTRLLFNFLDITPNSLVVRIGILAILPIIVFSTKRSVKNHTFLYRTLLFLIVLINCLTIFNINTVQISEDFTQFFPFKY